MSDHTPAPWGFDGVCQIVEVERPHMRICFLPSDHAEYASSKPNGYLIAAAPDLLEAIKECLPSMGWRNMSDEELEHEHELGNGFAKPILRARAAIRKAEGNIR